MNKQEAIKKVKDRSEYPGDFPCAVNRTPYVLDIIKEIDEPKNENHLHDVKSQIEYLLEHGPGKNKSLRMLENMVDNMLQGNWALARVQKEKVKVPAFAAEWVEQAKKEERTLFQVLDDIYDSCYYHKGDDATYRWLFGYDESPENQRNFARAYLDGYEVEEAPKWVVRIGKVYLTGNQAYSFAKEDATPFDLKAFALEAAEKTGGEIEKV